MRVAARIRRYASGVILALSLAGLQAMSAGAQSAVAPAPPGAQAVAERNAGIQLMDMPTKEVPSAYAGLPYSSSVMAEGGVGPYRVSVTGEMPPGVLYEPGFSVVTLRGVPTTPGTYTPQITVIDSAGAEVTHSYSIVVRPTPEVITPQVSVNVSDSEAMHITDAESVFFPAVIHVAEAMHISDGLMDVDSVRPVISEVFTTHDAISILLGSDNMIAEAMHITDATAVMSEVGVFPATAPAGSYNVAYSQAFNAVGSTGMATLTPAGTLPTGLSFTTSGGTTTLHGVPTQTGMFTFTITAKDGAHTNVVTYLLAIDSATQTITIGTLPSPVYGGAAFALSATASPSGLPVTIASTSGLVSGSNPFTPLAAGVASFQATQAGNANYATATPVNFNVTIAPAVLTVNGSSASRVFDQPNPALSAAITGYVNGDSPSVVSGAPVVSTTATPISPVSGSPYAVTTSLGTLSAMNYTFSFSNGALTLTPASQTITFYALPALVHGSTFPLSARASSGLPVTYAVSGAATIANNVLTVSGTGPVTVTASQAGNGNYSAATAVARSFTAQ